MRLENELLEPEPEPESDFFQTLSPEAREYIDFLEEELEESIEKIENGKNAIRTFIVLLAFISENFGETADYPVRIDSDFYKDVFLKQLNDCNEFVDQFKSKKLSLE
jgi:hypothetical protein